MQPPLRLLAGLSLACAILAIEPAASQEEPQDRPSAAKAKNKKKAPAAKPAKAKVGGPKTAKDKTAAKEKASAADAAQPPAAAPAPKVAASPAPRPLPEEATHIARYDAAIAPARDHPLSADDAGRIRNAVGAIADGELTEGKRLRDQITDPAGRKLIDWYLFRAGYGSAGEVRAFLAANPAWPDRALLTQRSEEALLNSAASAREIKAFFGDTLPQPEWARHWRRHWRRTGDLATARGLAAKAWVEFDIPAAHERAFLKKVGGLLTETDHKRRLDRLLLSDSRWEGERNERAVVIKRVIALLSEPERKKAQARLAVYLRAKNSNQLMSKLPPQALTTEWGLAMQKVQALRRQNKDEERGRSCWRAGGRCR